MKKIKLVKTTAAALAVFVGCLAQAHAATEVQVEITRIRVEDNVYTPYYTVRTEQDNQQGAAKKWIKLHIEYTTSGGWIDELHIEQLALVTDNALGVPIVLDQDTAYINIRPGDHYANVYMHPSLVDRYKVDAFEVDTAAVFRIDGKVVARSETTKNSKKGWSEESKALVHKGHLMNHAETPFWFINYDFKEIIKRNPHAHGEGQNFGKDG